MSNIPHEAIERYLTNQMGSDELASFEQSLISNAELRDEVSLQRTIINGIKEARKVELKTRLSEIPVSSSPWAGAMQSTWLKLATGAVVVGTLSFVTFYQLDFETDTNASFNTNPIEINGPTPSIDLEIIIPQKSTEVKEVVEFNKKSIPKEKKLINEQVKTLPQVIIPVPMNPEDKMLSEDEVSDPLTLPMGAAIENPVTVDVEMNAGIREYRYFDAVLSLRGDYQNVSYDILELNSKSGRELFLVMDGKYYSLLSTESYQPLQVIEDKKVLKKLEVLKDFK